MHNPKDLQISVEEYEKTAATSDYYLVDVREPWEVEIASMPHAVNIPLDQIPEKIQTLPQGREIIVYCHHGVRSLHITKVLREHGHFARSLKGGINAYAMEVDTSISTY